MFKYSYAWISTCWTVAHAQFCHAQMPIVYLSGMLNCHMVKSRTVKRRKLVCDVSATPSMGRHFLWLPENDISCFPWWEVWKGPFFDSILVCGHMRFFPSKRLLGFRAEALINSSNWKFKKNDQVRLLHWSARCVRSKKIPKSFVSYVSGENPTTFYVRFCVPGRERDSGISGMFRLGCMPEFTAAGRRWVSNCNQLEGSILTINQSWSPHSWMSSYYQHRFEAR
jgi:hypothetical protein